MKPRTFALFALSGMLVSGCIIIDADETGRENLHVETQFELPNLQSIAIGQDTIIIEIPGACATKQNTFPEVETYGRRKYEIGFGYSDPDSCNEESTGQARLEWSYDELGIPLDSTVRTLNRIAR